ncbi:MAG: glycosyltransferase [Acetobacteraceae bacterium]|nr:glycosyltransferase [Acetobacteraceae bacterium]
MHISLIVPAPFDTISGGYGYDRRIVDGLRADGHHVDVVELAGAFPTCDEAARLSARASWNRLAPDTRPVIDGLALPAFHGLEDVLAARCSAGLIHHPTSLETGLEPVAQAAQEDIEQRLFARLKRLIVTSETTAETLVTRFRIPEARVAAVVPGTDDAPRCAGSGGPTCEILSIGTLIPRKGHDLLLRALGRLWDLDWHLTIVGSPDRDPVHAHGLMALAEELDIARRVHFAGELTGDALERAWQGADLFALATHYEGYGMAIAEALKRGLPVVVTEGGAAGRLITPDSGCVCPAADRDQVSKSLRRMIFGGELRRDMAERAWQIGQSLPSWRTQAALFAQSLG